jgi:hypothetical protein
MALHDSINIDTVGEPINREIGVQSDTILARAFWSSERPQYRGLTFANSIRTICFTRCLFLFMGTPGTAAGSVANNLGLK